MNKLFILFVLLMMSATTYANDSTHWGYQGDNGPAHWSEINSNFSLCTKGKNQSPIDITHQIKAPHTKLNTTYNSTASEILNNGHTIQINMQSGSKITVDNQDFDLKQFHFHSPSENTINGKSFPLEGHFVHADKNGNLAVISLMFETGDKNTIIEKLWKHMPEKNGVHNKLNENITAMNLMPKKMDHYRFNGSLTTPPCSEGVRWFVLKSTITVSTQQVEHFKHTMHHANNRPTQSINARLILE